MRTKGNFFGGVLHNSFVFFLTKEQVFIFYQKKTFGIGKYGKEVDFVKTFLPPFDIRGTKIVNHSFSFFGQTRLHQVAGFHALLKKTFGRGKYGKEVDFSKTIRFKNENLSRPFCPHLVYVVQK